MYLFFNLKKYRIIFILIFLVFILLLFILSGVSFASATPKNSHTIVIDAGHGGVDGGSEGYSGSQESELNLEYAKKLKQYCEDYGFKVVLTRKDSNGLYTQSAPNKKKDDMQKRQQIIESANPDIVVSIHMNSFQQSYTRGAQVFYNKDCEASKVLADCIQKQFVQNLVKARKSTQAGDYYILNCTNVPSVICECGFVSNPEEEKLLMSDEYKNQVCYSILCGIFSYFTL